MRFNLGTVSKGILVAMWLFLGTVLAITVYETAAARLTPRAEHIGWIGGGLLTLISVAKGRLYRIVAAWLWVVTGTISVLIWFWNYNHWPPYIEVTLTTLYLAVISAFLLFVSDHD